MCHYTTRIVEIFELNFWLQTGSFYWINRRNKTFKTIYCFEIPLVSIELIDNMKFSITKVLQLTGRDAKFVRRIKIYKHYEESDSS